MGAIVDLVDLVTKLYGFCSNAKSDIEADRKKFFENFVVPPYEAIKVVHEDYLNVYTELIARIYEDDGISQKTINWLTQVRVKHQFDRSQLYSIKIPTMGFWWGSSDPKMKKLDSSLLAFGDSIKQYFGIRDLTSMSHTRSLMESIADLTMTPEELAVEKTLVSARDSGDPFDVIDKNLQYLLDSSGTLSKELPQRISDKLNLERVLAVQSDIRSLWHLDRDDLTNEDPGTLSRLLYTVLSKEEYSEQLRTEYVKLAEDDRLTKILAHLTEDEQKEWQQLVDKREKLKQDVYNPSFWVEPINQYNNMQVSLLQDRIMHVQKVFMVVKVRCI